jgi:hypothetical protein
LANVITANASAVTVPRQDRDSIRHFYRDVLGGKIVKENNEKEIFRPEGDSCMLFRKGRGPDAAGQNEAEALKENELSELASRQHQKSLKDRDGRRLTI